MHGLCVTRTRILGMHEQCLLDMEDIRPRASLCYEIPGMYTPRDIRKLRVSWKSTQRAFWYQFTEDFWVDDTSGRVTFFLRPTKAGESGGGIASLLPVHGECVHLGLNGCRLALAAMPIECVTRYSAGDIAPLSIERSYAPLLWGGECGLSTIKEFEAAVTGDSHDEKAVVGMPAYSRNLRAMEKRGSLARVEMMARQKQQHRLMRARTMAKIKSHCVYTQQA